MRTALISLVLISTLLAALPPVTAQSDDPPAAKYVPRYEDPVLKEMDVTSKKAKSERDKETREIRDRQAERKKKERAERRVLRFDLTGIEKPESPDAFRTAFHFPPVAQYRTGTCWSFAGTSFLESEIARLTGRRIKMSEMFTVYHEYLEKARRWIRERGDSELGQGSECNAVLRIWKRYGAVPHDVYPGVLAEDGRHDHSPLFAEIRNYLHFVRANDYWDEQENLAAIRLILNKHLGEPPAAVEWEGRTMSPVEFVRDVLAIDLDAYVAVQSTLAIPYWTKGEFDVPDNWWRCAEYHNLPLDDWYGVLRRAAEQGYTVALGGDTSEPGYNGFEDAAVVPPFDIPQEAIDASAREFRFYNRTTTDDHAVHLVGYHGMGGRDWYLIKDSARSSRHGKHPGLYFYRDDYIRLKMLTYLVHRDALGDLLGKFGE
jgi:bleomycin hydrolase